MANIRNTEVLRTTSFRHNDDDDSNDEGDSSSVRSISLPENFVPKSFTKAELKELDVLVTDRVGRAIEKAMPYC